MGKGAAKQAQSLANQASTNYGNLYSSLSPAGTSNLNTAANYYGNIIKGGPQAYQSISPQVDFTKQQFQNARRTLSQTAPAGGASAAGNRALAGQEAQTISGLYTQGINNALQGLTGIGSTQTQGALGATGGIQGLSGQMSQLSAQQAQAWASGLGGLASGIGTFFGLGGRGGGAGAAAGGAGSVFSQYPGAFTSFNMNQIPLGTTSGAAINSPALIYGGGYA